MATKYRLRDETGTLQRTISLSGSNAAVYDSDENTVLTLLDETFKVPMLIPDSNQSGLAADSTGTKWTSNFRFKLDPNRVVSAVVRATWTASAADSVAEIELCSSDGSSHYGSVSGNSGTDAEGSVSGFLSGTLLTVRLNITTASATSGATVDLKYVVIEVTYR